MLLLLQFIDGFLKNFINFLWVGKCVIYLFCGSSQVVGWPPIRAYRMNSLVSQAKALTAEDDKADSDNDKCKKKPYTGGNKNKNNSSVNEKGHLGFVKVNMDGLPIGRKVDLDAHACYETLAQTLEDMFFSPNASMPPLTSKLNSSQKIDVC